MEEDNVGRGRTYWCTWVLKSNRANVDRTAPRVPGTGGGNDAGSPGMVPGQAQATTRPTKDTNTQMATPAPAVPVKNLGALDALRSLGRPKPTPGTILPAGMTDPAIVGAKKDKNTVKLGFDPSMAEKAAYTAKLAEALEQARTDFEIVQAEMRDYGISKRALYNSTFKANVTTVNVPYLFTVPNAPGAPEDAPVAQETRHIQCICSNRYSVGQEIILNNRESFGEHFDRLFTTTVTKTLKPNAEDLIRGVLLEAGMAAEEVDKAMDSLLETTTKVSAKEDFEQESAAVPEAVQTILKQAVTRSQPGLKFPRA